MYKLTPKNFANFVVYSDACGGDLEAVVSKRRRFSTPINRRDFSNNAGCEWNIRKNSSNEVVVLSLSVYDIEEVNDLAVILSPANISNGRNLATIMIQVSKCALYDYQRCSRGHKARGQGHKKISRPRPRTNPLEAKAKDQGHRRKCSSKKKRSSKKFFRRKRSSKFFFQAISTWGNKKKVSAYFLQGFWRFPTKFQRFKNSVVLEPRTGKFSRIEASRPRPRTSKCVLEDVFEDSTSDDHANNLDCKIWSCFLKKILSAFLCPHYVIWSVYCSLNAILQTHCSVKL